MSAQTKTDNHNPEAKLLLRRYFLCKYHAQQPPRVMDCFQGSGFIWNELAKEFTLGSYWGMDIKPKSGRLKIDSARVLEQSGWQADVVDLDAYGSPWKHWMNLCRTFCGSELTVFLTIGVVQFNGVSNYDKSVLRMAGYSLKTRPPNSLGSRLNDHALGFALGFSESNGLTIGELREAFPQKNARYIGLRIEKRCCKDHNDATP